MTASLIALVVLVGTVAVLNLLLTVGVIRRLRQHTEKLATLEAACRERLPEFVAKAESFPGGRSQVLAVLAGERDEVEEYRQQLAPVARVVIESLMQGAVATALKVQGYPAFAVLDGTGTVMADGLDLHQLPVAAPAAV